MPTAQFEADSKDYERHHLLEFYRSSAFLSKYGLADNGKMIEPKEKLWAIWMIHLYAEAQINKVSVANWQKCSFDKSSQLYLLAQRNSSVLNHSINCANT